jgi:hypothetical protein
MVALLMNKGTKGANEMGEDAIPGLIGQTAFFNTDDGLWWDLGIIVDEQWRMTAGGPQWCFRLENGHWLRDLRQNDKFQAANIDDDDDSNA